jgi:ABC-type uncharacterized transport system substrate-binding protein
MNLKALLPALLPAIFPGAAGALAETVYRIGAAVSNDPSMPAIEGFKSKMAAPGYFEGKSVKYEVGNARADGKEIKKIGHTLVQSKPDLIE